MIRRLLMIAAGIGVGAGALAGCQREDSSIKDKLAQIDKRLSSIEEGLARVGAAGGRGMPPQRARANPADVYSVPIAGAPSRGPAQAKVTIVEAFEFA
jgi:hypothetical protein